MYKKTYEIHTYEVDAYKRITLPTIFAFFQDIMMHNADSYGAGDDFHDTQDMIWVLIDYEVEVLSYPKGKQTVIAKTIPYSFKRFYGYRLWELTLKDGTVVAKGKGKFVLINKKTKQIETPSKELIDRFKDAIKEPKALSFSNNKQLSPPYQNTYKDIVKPSDIDLNNHMNNIKYIQKAYDTIPYKILENNKITTVRVTYKKESVINEPLTIRQVLNENRISFQFEVDDEIKAIIRMETKTSNSLIA